MAPHSPSAMMDSGSDHEKSSLISALSDADTVEDDVVATETSSLIGASTQIGNATTKSGDSYYFATELPPTRTRSATSKEDDEVATETSFLMGASTHSSNDASNSRDSKSPRPTKSHRRSDSLCYSTNSSVNSFTIEEGDFCEHKQDDEDGVTDSSRLSYLGSIINSLNAQQSFPSSMFPGQQLISPSSKRAKKTLSEEEKENLDYTSLPQAVSSYYYYETTPYKNQKSLLLPPTYHTADVNHTNVYLNTHKGFCNDPSDIDTDDDALFFDNDGTKPSSSWRRCMRCFFSPRVLLTLAICGILAFNLLRLGGHNRHHHYLHKNGEHYHDRYLPTNNDDMSRKDYSNLRVRVIGDSDINKRLGSSSLLSVAKEINNEIDTPSNEENTGKRQ